MSMIRYYFRHKQLDIVCTIVTDKSQEHALMLAHQKLDVTGENNEIVLEKTQKLF